MSTTDVRQDLLELEHAGWQSLCEGSGSAFYERTMTEDGLMVLANGQIMERGEVADALRDAPPWADYDIDQPRLVELGPDTVALVYVGTGRREGADDFRGVMTSVYRRVDGEWRLGLYQQTVLAPA